MGIRSVFVSHASDDKLAFRPIAAALEKAAATVWDYVSPDQSVHSAAELQRGLADRISQAELFILILSHNSIGKAFVRFEAGEATRRGFIEQGRAQLVVIEPAPAQPWPAPFDRFAEIERPIRIQPADPDSVAKGVRHLCEVLGIPCSPIPEPHPRLPLMRQLYLEVKNLFETDRGRAAATGLQRDYEELLRLIEDFADHYQKQDYPEACALSERIAGCCAKAFPEYDPYYPRVATAVCRIHLRQFDRAEREIEALRTHPLADEHIDGGLGQVHLGRGDYGKAELAFEMAYKRCLQNGRPTETARFNLLLCGFLRDGDWSSKELAQLQIEPASEEEDLNQKNVLAAMLVAEAEAAAATGGPKAAAPKAKAALSVLRGTPEHRWNANTVTQWATALWILGMRDEATRSLSWFIGRLEREPSGRARRVSGDEVQVFHHLARLNLQMGQIEKALAIYNEALCGEPSCEWRFELERVRLWLLQKDPDKAAAKCRELLADSRRTVSTQEDYYWSGLAHFICGNKREARLHLARSGGFGSEGFAALLERDALGPNSRRRRTKARGIGWLRRLTRNILPQRKPRP